MRKGIVTICLIASLLGVPAAASAGRPEGLSKGQLKKETRVWSQDVPSTKIWLPKSFMGYQFTYTDEMEGTSQTSAGIGKTGYPHYLNWYIITFESAEGASAFAEGGPWSEGRSILYIDKAKAYYGYKGMVSNIRYARGKYAFEVIGSSFEDASKVKPVMIEAAKAFGDKFPKK